jgi:hypothetical protein
MANPIPPLLDSGLVPVIITNTFFIKMNSRIKDYCKLEEMQYLNSIP